MSKVTKLFKTPSGSSIMKKRTSLFQEECQAVEELRLRLEKAGILDMVRLKSSQFLGRYVRYCKFNVEKAEKMIKFYMDYNQMHELSLIQEKFPQDWMTSYTGGFDWQGRPVLMIPDMTNWSLKKYDERGQSHFVLRYFIQIQLTMDRLALERDADFGIVLADLTNMPYFDYVNKKSVTLVIETLKFIENHSPGAIGLIIMVNAPKVLKILFDTFKSLVTLTADVIFMSSSDKDWKEGLRVYFSVEGISPHFGGTLTSLVEL